jgi:hypothetical protein
MINPMLMEGPCTTSTTKPAVADSPCVHPATPVKRLRHTNAERVFEDTATNSETAIRYNKKRAHRESHGPCRPYTAHPQIFRFGMRPVEIARSLRLAHSIVATQLRNIGPTGRASPTPGVIPPSMHWPLRAFGKRKLRDCSAVQGSGLARSCASKRNAFVSFISRTCRRPAMRV